MTRGLAGEPRNRWGLPAWFLLVILFWLPFEFLLMNGLHRSHEALVEGADGIVRNLLRGKILEFRYLLQAENALSARMKVAVEVARTSGSPEEWFGRVKGALGDFPAGSFELLLTNGREVIPVTPGWDPATLSHFLGITIEKAECFSNTTLAAAYLRKHISDAEFFGVERFSKWKWIPLPGKQGFPNQVFDRNWLPDTVFTIYRTPRNTWGAFGRVGEEGWTYLIRFHRQNLPEGFLLGISDQAARERGIPVTREGFGPPVPEESKPGWLSEIHEAISGRGVSLREFDEKAGWLVGRGRIPRSLWAFLILAHIANFFLSIAALGGVFRLLQGESYDRLAVSRKVFLGLLGGAGLPLVFALIATEGATGARIFREIQKSQLEMDQSLRLIESEFEKFTQEIGQDHREDAKGIEYPWDPVRGERWVDQMSTRHEVISQIEVISSAGVRLTARGPFSWSCYRASRLPREPREEHFRRWSRRGFLFLKEDLDMLSLDDPGQPSPTSDKLFRLVTELAKNNPKMIKLRLIEVLGKRVCAAVNGIGDTGSEESSGGGDALIEVAFKGRDAEFFQDILVSLGLLKPVQFGMFRGLSFSDVVRDKTGRAQFFVVIFHRVSDLTEKFLYQVGSRRLFPDRYSFLGISMFYAKVDFGGGLEESRRLMVEDLFTEIGQNFHGILPDEEGYPRLFAISRGRGTPDYTLALSLPMAEIARSIIQERRLQISFLLFLLLALIGISWWLRRLLLKPLGNLQTLVNAMVNGTYEGLRIEPGIGELGTLAGLFADTLDGIRQMDMARIIQDQLLPSAPVEAGGFRMAGKSLMMSQVGGDYFDMIPRGKDRLLLVVGDVSGHGLSAAIIVAMMKSGLTALAETDLEPNDILQLINGVMFKTLARKKMMTVFLGSLDVIGGRFTYTNAGHNFPYLRQQYGDGTFLKQANLPLGAVVTRKYKVDSIVLGKGDLLILYSDGITEVVNPAGKIPGYGGVKEFLDSVESRDPLVVVPAVIEFARGFSQGVPFQDDLTVLVLNRLG